MTTITSSNIHNVAIDGTFDDCQDLVKAMFGDTEFRQKHRLAAVNSINWARIAAQTVYYFTSAAKILPNHRHERGPAGGSGWGRIGEHISFVVPTGNFGNVFAGYVAAQMGLPVDRLVVATNHNDILTRTISSGTMEIGDVRPSTSPAMDIQVASNFERLLYYASDKDSEWLDDAMRSFRSEGTLTLPSQVRDFLHKSFYAGMATENWVDRTIREQSEMGLVVDPHTAVALKVATGSWKFLAAPAGGAPVHGPPMAIMSTAHPAKFPDVVEQATGMTLTQPEELAALVDKPERCADLPNDLASVMEFVSSVSQ
jgi:threonine synthase